MCKFVIFGEDFGLNHCGEPCQSWRSLLDESWHVFEIYDRVQMPLTENFLGCMVRREASRNEQQIEPGVGWTTLDSAQLKTGQT